MAAPTSSHLAHCKPETTEQQMQTPSAQSLTFMTLPSEIREAIYHQLMTTRMHIDNLTGRRTDWYDVTPMFLCKQIKAEYSALLERTFAKIVIDIHVFPGPIVMTGPLFRCVVQGFEREPNTGILVSMGPFFECGLLGLERTTDVDIVFSLQPKGMTPLYQQQEHQGHKQEEAAITWEMQRYMTLITGFVNLSAELKRQQNINNIQVECVDTMPDWLRMSYQPRDQVDGPHLSLYSNEDDFKLLSSQDLQNIFSDIIQADASGAILSAQSTIILSGGGRAGGSFPVLRVVIVSMTTGRCSVAAKLLRSTG